MTKKCRVMYDGQHLATIWHLDDGTWEVQPTDVHLPTELLIIGKQFEPYVGRAMPGLVAHRMPSRKRIDFIPWLQQRGLTWDDPLGIVIAMGGRATDRIKFVP